MLVQITFSVREHICYIFFGDCFFQDTDLTNVDLITDEEAETTRTFPSISDVMILVAFASIL